VKRLGLAIVVAAAACSTGPASVGARLAGPSAVVAYHGITNKNILEVRPYLALAQSRGNDLRIIDPNDNQPVLGPAVVFPLSVPTDPRPLLLAAAPIETPVPGATPQPDALVAVSAGELTLQVIETWSPQTRVAFTVPLDGSDPNVPRVVADGSDILAVRGLTVPGAQPARARILVVVREPTTGGRLVSVDFVRAADGSSVQLAAAAAQPAPLGFTPSDLAVEPSDSPAVLAGGFPRLFLATLDRLPTGQLGVAEVDMTANASDPWAVSAMDARGPTRAVAAATLREVDVPNRNVFFIPNSTTPQVETFTQPALRVYALLDTSGCGPQQRIACGVATLDPATKTLALDPAASAVQLNATTPAQGYRAPMLVPAIGSFLGIQFPPSDIKNVNNVRPDPSHPEAQFVTLLPGTGATVTSAVGGVPASDGRVYILDLGRYSTVSDSVASVTRVTTASSNVPTANLTTFIGLASTFPPGSTPAIGRVPVIDQASLLHFIQVTPGFTPNETWAVTWQGVLPALSGLSGVVVTSGADQFVAAQRPTTTEPQKASDPASWLVQAEIGAPELGVHDGDIVQVLCPGSAAFVEATVAAGGVLQPGAPSPAGVTTAFPGGALKLAAAACPFDGAATITVRASGLVLTGLALGYTGRPQLGQPFALQWRDETPFEGATDAASREALMLARKARRQNYPSDLPCSQFQPGCYTGLPWLADPLAAGPVVAFVPTLVDTTGAAPLVTNLARDTALVFTTQASFAPMSRKPITGGAAPVGIISLDPSILPGDHTQDSVRFYVPYVDDQLFLMSPAQSISSVASIR
jgi:hypothetical protein